MTKQKVVIRIPMNDAKKKAKALAVIVKFPGVISVEVDNGKLNVVGQGVDPVALISCIRKKMHHAEIVSVAAVEEKKEEDKLPPPMIIQPSNLSHSYSIPTFNYHEGQRNDSCGNM